LVFFGLISFLQGINVVPGSFMTGQIRWPMYGAIAVAAGTAVASGQPARAHRQALAHFLRPANLAWPVSLPLASLRHLQHQREQSVLSGSVLMRQNVTATISEAIEKTHNDWYKNCSSGVAKSSQIAGGGNDKNP
jgi:hypothetical protein